MNCICQEIKEPSSEEAVVQEFFHLRDNCLALQSVLIPLPDLREYRNASIMPRGDALHYPSLVLAFHRRQLHKITAAIHRFALDFPAGKKLSSDYLGRLSEMNSLRAEKSIDRHDRGRSYRGSLFEFITADWLAEQGWGISGMEAWGDDFDIQGEKNDEYDIEVKYIGRTTTAFLNMEKSLAGRRADAEWGSDGDSVVARTFEAALQLASSCKKKMAIILLEDISILAFSLKTWTNWKSNPSFVNKMSEPYLSVKAKNPNVDTEIKSLITSLDKLWFITAYDWSLKLWHAPIGAEI